jgi:hypothetical protein
MRKYSLYYLCDFIHLRIVHVTDATELKAKIDEIESIDFQSRFDRVMDRGDDVSEDIARLVSDLRVYVHDYVKSK